MVIIKPFKATILNPELEARTELICPVYDTIDASRYNTYSTKRNNVIHITTRREGVPENDFVAYAKTNLNRFVKDDILVERENASLYIYGIRYKLPEAVIEQIPEHERRDTYFAFGLVALVKVEKLNEHNILGHEKIFEANTQERYHLMKGCGMNFSPIVAEYTMPTHDINRMFEDYLGFRRPELKIDERKKPLVDVVLNGARHILWEVSDNNVISRIQQLLRDKKIMVLDGHHRYTASYRLSQDQDGGTDYTLMMLLEGGDRALVLLPWHRCVKRCRMEDLWTRINDNFAIEAYDKRVYDMKALYSKLGGQKHYHPNDVILGMYDGERFYTLHADEQRIQDLATKRDERVGLDVISLHEWLIDPTLIGKPEEDIIFASSLREAIDNVDKGAYQVAFFLTPLRISDVEYKSEVEKKAFPQKSTLFLPKVAEGVVMRRWR
jgi:uncharacterized protein (DUF1015 family)